MKQTPILFSTPMVQAILEGRKTQTRRVIKLSDGSNPDDSCISYSLDGKPENYVMDFTKHFPNWEPLHCPYGQPGDVLWVRESFYKTKSDAVKDKYFYKEAVEKLGWSFKWKPSIHMPKEACRIWLRITNIRIERLQQITEQDAKSEGIERMPTVHWWKNYLSNPLPGTSSPIESFISLWKSINGTNSWDENPYVWVIEFEQTQKPSI